MFIINHSFLIVCLTISWPKQLLSFGIYPMEISQTGLNTCFWTEIFCTMRTLCT